MADSDVQVKFGAQIEGLIAGVEAVKEQITSISGPINSVISSLGEMKEALLAGFAIDKGAEFVDRITEIGEQIERGTEMTGLSAREFQTLSYAMKATGGEAGNLGIVIGRLERNIALARGGSGQAVQAFQTLGVSMEDLKNKTPYAIIEQIANGFHNLKDPILAAGAATEVGSRGFAQLLPALKAGSEGIEEFGEQFRQTGAYMNDVQASSFAKTHESLIELRTALEGTGVQLVRLFKPAIDLTVTALTELVEWLNKVIGALADLVNILEGSILVGFAKVIELVEKFGVEGTLAADKVKIAWQALGRTLEDIRDGQLSSVSSEWNIANAQIEVATKKADAALKQYTKQYDDLVVQIARATGALTNFWGSLGEKKGEEGGGGALGTGKGKDEDLQIALDQVKTEEELAKIGLQTRKDMLEQEVAVNKISKAQEFEALQEYLQLEYGVESAALDKKLELYENDVVEYQKTLDQKKLLDAQYEQQLARLSAQEVQAQAQAANKTAQQWKPVLDTIGRDFDTMLSGVLSGTQTWQQAMGKAFSDMAVSAVEAMAKIIAEWLVFEVLTEGQGSWGDFMALEGSGKAGIGDQIIKSFDVGSWNVDRDQLAFVHQGEMIVPAAQAGQIRSGGASLGGGSAGGVGVTMNVTALDSKSIITALNNPSVLRQLSKNIGSYMSANPSVRGAY